MDTLMEIQELGHRSSENGNRRWFLIHARHVTSRCLALQAICWKCACLNVYLLSSTLWLGCKKSITHVPSCVPNTRHKRSSPCVFNEFMDIHLKHHCRKDQLALPASIESYLIWFLWLLVFSPITLARAWPSCSLYIMRSGVSFHHWLFYFIGSNSWVR